MSTTPADQTLVPPDHASFWAGVGEWLENTRIGFGEPAALVAERQRLNVANRLASWLGEIECVVRRLVIAAALALDLPPPAPRASVRQKGGDHPGAASLDLAPAQAQPTQAQPGQTQPGPTALRRSPPQLKILPSLRIDPYTDQTADRDRPSRDDASAIGADRPPHPLKAWRDAHRDQLREIARNTPAAIAVRMAAEEARSRFFQAYGRYGPQTPSRSPAASPAPPSGMERHASRGSRFGPVRPMRHDEWPFVDLTRHARRLEALMAIFADPSRAIRSVARRLAAHPVLVDAIMQTPLRPEGRSILGDLMDNTRRLIGQALAALIFRRDVAALPPEKREEPD